MNARFGPTVGTEWEDLTQETFSHWRILRVLEERQSPKSVFLHDVFPFPAPTGQNQTAETGGEEWKRGGF